jgi:hypothetical protein
MSWIITIAGWLQIVAGVFILIAARSAMHETTAAVGIGFGFVCLALGRMLQYREEDEKRRAAVDSSAEFAEWKRRIGQAP